MLRGAIIGFGEVARNGHWPGYETSGDIEIVAIVDRSDKRRALASSVVPGARTFAALDEVPSSLSVDFADVCTPPSLHAQPMLEALGRGWHVLCEKPFLLDPALVDIARAGALAANVALLPVHNWKYAPIVREATSALRSGAIGTLTRVEIETCRLQAAPTADASGVNWRGNPVIAGGGILMDHGWHSVYLALHWFGERATGVRASLHRPPAGNVEDEAAVTVEFPSGEAQIALTWNGDRRRNAMRLEGTLGEIILADDTLHVRSGGLESTSTFSSALSAGSHHADWFRAMLPDVVACFRQPVLSRPLFEEAADCLGIIQRAYRYDESLAARLG